MNKLSKSKKYISLGDTVDIVDDLSRGKLDKDLSDILDYDQISLEMTADPDTISDSGLSFSVGSFNQPDGTITGSLMGTPLSIGEDTDYRITLRAEDTNESSYNSELTLTIRVLADPDYYSPS